jgi:hypothetical protein
MTEIQVYNDNFYHYYKKNIDILLNAGFKPYAYTQYACEDTFIFHTEEEATEAYNTLEVENKVLCGWFYPKKEFEDILIDYKKEYGIDFPNKIYYVPYTDKEKSDFQMNRFRELISESKSNYPYIKHLEPNLRDNLSVIAMNVIDRLEELNITKELLAYKTGINLFDISLIVKGHAYNITLDQILTLNKELNINVCSTH